MSVDARRFRSVTRIAATLSLLLAGLAQVGNAQAGSPGDYAWRWPLQTGGQGADRNAAWQFELTPEVYAALVDPQLRDFEVFNAQGQSVPVARLRYDPATLPGVAQVALPVFPLPRTATTVAGEDISVRLQRDDDGRLHLLQASVIGADTQVAIDYVMDADIGRDPARPSSVDRLELRWPETGRDVRARFAVEGSDDLEHWQPLVDATTVLSLRRDRDVLTRRLIELSPTALRYLRLRQLDGDPLPSLTVTARRTRAGATPPQWRRVKADFVAAGQDAYSREHTYQYKLPARLPVGRVGIALGADNATAQVVVDARGDGVWLPLGQTLLFRLRQGALQVDNEDYVPVAPVTTGEWRLRSRMPLAPSPRLDVAYLPDRFVFLAQGAGPYTLAAGSRVAQRQEQPVEQALAPLRARLGAQWVPPVAPLGARTRGDASAYAEPDKPIDWRTWTLWGLLIAGALVVGGFALTLLRVSARQSEDEGRDAGRGTDGDAG